VIIEVELPDSCGVQDVDVEFTGSAPSCKGRPDQQALVLTVQSFSKIVPLPCQVDESRCTAKFDKRKQVLKVTVPVI